MAITNAVAVRALALDPRVQEALWTKEMIESADFKALMEIMARTDLPIPLFVPLTSIITAVAGDVVLGALLGNAVMLTDHEAMTELRAVAQVDAEGAA